MQADPINDYAFVVAPGKKEVVSVIAGNFFYILAVSHPRFRVKINDGKPRAGSLARGHNYGPGFAVEKVEIENLDPAAELTGTLQVGTGTPLDNALNVYQNEVAPNIRVQPSVRTTYAEIVGTALNVGQGVVLFPADPTRTEVWLRTDAFVEAYWCSAPLDVDNLAAAGPNALAAFNLVDTAEADGWVRVRHQGEIQVLPVEVGRVIHGISFNV